jgi:catechol 2,3-dioxygenase-like lactoylglutathione lyase family enzyme
MIKAKIGHAVLNIDPNNAGFYKQLLTFMGWKVLFEMPGMLGMGDDQDTSLWFAPPIKGDVKNDYDGPGTNHLAFSVGSQKDVDEAVVYLEQRGIAALFETPRHRPEFTHGSDQTYYQVMFESPDRLLFEIVYTGPIEK